MVAGQTIIYAQFAEGFGDVWYLLADKRKWCPDSDVYTNLVKVSFAGRVFHPSTV